MITLYEAIALGVAVAEHSEAIYAKAWALKDAIDQATSVDDINAIAW